VPGTQVLFQAIRGKGPEPVNGVVDVLGYRAMEQAVDNHKRGLPGLWPRLKIYLLFQEVKRKFPLSIVK
jgi:hypothetical protein